ncbi:group II intron maturase-specific domain-containing protein [Breznakia pachnodae]|uniref:Group II intron maturase-specific domain-containing protein n=1 Tax=Breznakia pachnodae TaxID=265178 RepID=A0ABU0E0Q0_9FIRM|nr:group II intron maturase-specific domain-containing protein [Breznakia pachnodae]MDQ0360464.1 hypothetical protein [Breznakia pachnodae]
MFRPSTHGKQNGKVYSDSPSTIDNNLYAYDFQALLEEKKDLMVLFLWYARHDINQTRERIQLRVVTAKRSEPEVVISDDIDERLIRLKYLFRGWYNYFKIRNIQLAYKAIDGHTRYRLRICIWKQ